MQYVRMAGMMFRLKTRTLGTVTLPGISMTINNFHQCLYPMNKHAKILNTQMAMLICKYNIHQVSRCLAVSH